MKNNNSFIRHLVSLFTSSILLCVSILGIHNYQTTYPCVSFGIGYFGSLVCLPLALFLVCWKRRPLRWYLLVCCVLITSLSVIIFFARIEIVDKDYSGYLDSDSPFVETAARFLPSEKTLENADIISYVQGKQGSKTEYIYLEVQHQDQQYRKKLDQHFASFFEQYSQADCWEGESFQMNGHTYRSCVYADNSGRYYVYAYAFCSENNTAFYVFFTDYQLAFMSVGSVVDFLDI